MNKSITFWNLVLIATLLFAGCIADPTETPSPIITPPTSPLDTPDPADVACCMACFEETKGEWTRDDDLESCFAVCLTNAVNRATRTGNTVKE